MKSCLRSALTALLILITTLPALAGEKVTYYHNDALGSPVAATNQQGQVIWRETYKPYGQRTTNDAASANNTVWFTGKQEENALGINYFGARWYNPEVGRFLIFDPSGASPDNIRSFNRYAYANNNPYANVDPDGREAACLYSGGCSVQITPASVFVVKTSAGFIPVVGDALGVHEAIENPTPINVISAVVGLVPLVGNAAGGELRALKNGSQDFDTARKAAFEHAGMTDPAKVQFSKMGPKTGTVVEFKGEGGAKVGYDGPHDSPGPNHDTQHVSWQSAGKRGSGGAQRGNEPYSGPQHPSRSDRKN